MSTTETMMQELELELQIMKDNVKKRLKKLRSFEEKNDIVIYLKS